MQSSATSSLLLNSSSLKDLLNGVSDVRKRKIAIAKSEEMVGAILRKDAHDDELAKKRQRARAAKRKTTKKRSLLDRSNVGGGLNRARQMHLASNNVFEFALDTGLDRDCVEHLERQYRESRNTVKDCVEKVQLGFEQLNGPETALVAPTEADILLTLLGAELESDAFVVNGTSFPCADTLHEPPPNSVEAATDVPVVAENTSQHAVKSGVPIDRFTRGLENYLQQRVMLLNLGEINGYTSKNAVDRFLHRDGMQHTLPTGSLENSLFGTSQLEVGGQMDASLYDTAPDLNSKTAHFNDTSDLHNMFVSSTTVHRPNSQPEDFYGTSTMGSQAPRMRLENDSNYYSQSEKDILPPLRLGRMLRKQRKDLGLSLGKKHFSKAGFDASFTRATPRVLQSKSTVGKDFNQGGGATEAEIEALRWELTVAREGIKHLDKMVDTNIAWVQSNCDMSGMTVNFSDRTKQKCRNMATERIVAVYANLAENTLYWAVRRWQTAVRFDRLSLTVKKFSKLKGIEILTKTMWKAITNQMYTRGWKPWLRFVQAQILAKMNAAATQIQRIVRGRQGRVRHKKIKLGQVAITLQNMFRKAKAVTVIKEKRFVREQELNNAAVRAIQKLLSNLLKIRRAKEEVNQRRRERASIRIQKIHRGRQGRKDFLQKFLKKNHAEREDLDLERLAAAAPVAQPRSHDSADTLNYSIQEAEQEDTTHDPRKRSLFQPRSTAAAASPKGKQPKAVPIVTNKNGKKKGEESPSYRRPTTPTGAEAQGETSVRSTRKSPASSLSQPKHRHESPNPVSGRHKSGGNEEKSVRSARPKVTEPKHSAHAAAAPSEAHVPTTGRRSPINRTPSKSTTPISSRPASARRQGTNGSLELSEGSSRKAPSRGTSRAESPVPLAGTELLEGSQDEDDLAGDAILLEKQPSIPTTSKAAKIAAEADNSASSVSSVTRSRLNRSNATSESDSTPPPTHTTRTKTTRVPYNNTAASSKSTARRSTKAAGASVTPADAAANIQKVARGKIARVRSKKMLDDKSVSDGNASPSSMGSLEPSEKIVDVPDTIEAPEIAEPVAAEAPAPVAEEEEGPLALEMTDTFGANAASESHDHNNVTASGEQDSTHDFDRTPSRDYSSRPSSSQSLRSLIPSSILANFHLPGFGTSPKNNDKDRPRSGSTFRIPGFSAKSDVNSTSGSAAPSPVNGDRPRSSSFFRNPFAGWSSRETTPLRSRSRGEESEKDNSVNFSQHPNVIPEDVQEDDQARQDASIRRIQSHARGMLGRRRFSTIKEQKEAEATAAAAVQALAVDEEEAAARLAREIQSAKLKTKSGTVPNIASPRLPEAKPAAAKPGSASATRSTAAVRRGSFGNKAETSVHSTGRRSSFDKEKANDRETSVHAPTRRKSLDKEKTNNATAAAASVREQSRSPKNRRSSFDKSTESQVSKRRPSFDKEGSFDKEEGKERSVNLRRASFDKEKTSVSRRSSFDKSKDEAVAAAHAAMNKPPSASRTSSRNSSGRATPERRVTAPVGTMNSAAAVAVATAGVRTPTDMGHESGDDYVSLLPHKLPPTEEFPDVPDYTDPSVRSDGADLSEADHSESNKRAHSSSSEKKAPAGGSGSKKVKEDPARKAAQKKKDAEDKRKAEAAKAKAAREERSVHKSANSKTDTAKQAKSTPAATTPQKKPEIKASTVSEKKNAKDLTPLVVDEEPVQEDHTPVVSEKRGTSSRMPRLEEVNSGTFSDSNTPLRGTTPKANSPKTNSPKPTFKAATPKFRTKPNLDPAHAAACIQRHARRKISQARIEKQKEMIISAQKKLGMLIHWAVITIQRNFRGRTGRKNFVKHSLAKQVEWAQREEASARKMQAVARGRMGRKKASFLRDRLRKERQEQAWLESYYKGGKKAPMPKGDGMSTKATRSAKVPRSGKHPEPPSEPAPNAAAAAFTAQQTEEMDSKIRELKEIQRSIQEQQEKMAEYARMTEANAAKMQQAVVEMEENAKKQEAERLLQQQLFAMAAGPLSHRSDYASPMSTQQRRGLGTARQIVPNSARVPDAPPTARSARGGASIPPDAPQMYHNGALWVQLWDPDENAYYWYCERTQISQWDAPGTARSSMGTSNSGNNATMPMASSRRSVPNSARVPNAPPTARSARSAQGGSSIPPDAPQMTYNAEVWVQLWDSDESAYYWYCERTGFAQWEAPGSAGNQSTTTMVANYYGEEGADSGYESAGAMTDYSTDYNEDHSAYTSDSEFEGTVWQEFWDESAQAKYWYNNNTGEASWTRPETAASSHASEDAPLAITNGIDNDAAGGANEWVSYIDEDTEQAYWYNVRTGETSWA